MFEFPDVRFNLGDYAEAVVQWLRETFSLLFDWIFQVGVSTINGINDGLELIPWWLFILIVIALGWYLQRWISGLLYGLFLFIIGTFDYWSEMLTTLSIVMSAVLVCLIIGVPLGILMAFSKWFSIIMRPILDAMQTMPSFIYLIPAIFFFGLGNVSAIFATIIYAVPPVIRLTELAIRGVSPSMVESAQSFGSSKGQTLWKVQLPQAVPTIMAGVNQTTMMALAMVVIASMVGARGLGEDVLIAINTVNFSLGFEAGLSIVFIAIIIDRLTSGVADKIQKHRRVAA
ncbi:L-proline glycine betaine ABC transport system permease protein ProW [Bacillus sp. JCM 19046]|uniref:Glycine betaine/proline transport system permease protein n=1 Tax=Shouchella xiaoxiensis TaxID=766895 RepID=A0ABS2SWY5_9BACI|nr:proline/glycine betaine ABC transporter permease [Shouchella xiaoxiensis]MBM7840049.1 glycine betaine/proline transport system permease protein [Shouchella xiaoxiensis]GAF17852.1 L-proline glycine betaine ABC transport system permease protein ProW [Bacillus sp. JCM 19046]